MEEKQKSRPLEDIVVVIAILLLLAAGTYAAYVHWIKPSEIKPLETPEAIPTATPEATPTPTPEPIPEGMAPETARQEGVYTFLLAGQDQMSGSTDTIIVGRLDTVRHEINFVSIPRDTLLNVDAEIRKINAVYQGSLNFGGTGIDMLNYHVKSMVGFVPDCYAVINLNTFIELIDAIGGVDFDVPYPVDYYFSDIRRDLYVCLEPGLQHLNGEEAMAVCRNRAGYGGADLQRIEVQHAFLKSCMDQFLSLGTIPHIREVLDVLERGVRTDLSPANMAWFLKQALKCKSENIRFYTMPTDVALLQGYSYDLPQISEWISMINQCLNPYSDAEIGYGNLNVVFCNGPGSYWSTVGYLDGDWYYR
ncbi:MAG: LCP family protein [Oscillospiraceae bacterium]|nr:LCP family protein [Oscillospiraceae bacterium]